MGTLSRAEMEQAIIQGGAVLYKGATYTRVQDLPSEAELAAGDPEQEAVAAAALDAQIKALQAQRDKIGAASQAPTIGSAPKAQQEQEPKNEPKKGK